MTQKELNELLPYLTEQERERLDNLLAPSMRELPSYLAANGMQENAVTKTIANLISRHKNGEALRVVLSTPPRHGKTETFLYAFANLLYNDPTRTHVYATYGQDLANSKSRSARQKAREIGVKLSIDSKSVKEWRTEQGGGLLATGVGGPLTGQGITGIGVIDDPFKNRKEAESALTRSRLYEWFTDVFYTRLEPGASAVTVATRWHPDDLSGRLIEDGWEYINLPAVNDSNEALWPERFPMTKLNEIKEQIGEYSWASLYQGSPRPKGGAVFKEPTYYDKLPNGGYQEYHGFDAAYTSSTRADYSVVLSGRVYDGKLYLTNMIREQLEPEKFAAKVKAQGVNKVAWFLSGSESGLVTFLRSIGIKVLTKNVTNDKFVRAQPIAAAWNRGEVLLPVGPSWVEDLEAEFSAFTGISDLHDDIVDAGAALYDVAFGTKSLPARRQSMAYQGSR